MCLSGVDLKVPWMIRFGKEILFQKTRKRVIVNINLWPLQIHACKHTYTPQKNKETFTKNLWDRVELLRLVCGLGLPANARQTRIPHRGQKEP